jgi:hypothetical protein
MHAADPVREVVILRGRDRRRQIIDAQLFQAGEEALLLLTAKRAEDEFGGVRSAAPRHQAQDEAGETSLIEIGDAAPSQPQRLL